MELKRYQQEVINDLTRFIAQLKEDNNLAVAYRNFWESRGIVLSNLKSDYLRGYDNSIKGVPRVTVKVPTAGGKTFIACNALRPIFNSFPSSKPQVVAWFVPSDTILKQTYQNLNNPSHPYRQKIDSHFGGAVRVIDKESALNGQGLNRIEVQEQLTILVLSVQSFAANNKSGRLVYRENENLAEHAKGYLYKDKMIANADETSLIQVLAQLNPVVIIDESHNFEANLRIDMLNDINPSFILDLTATPRNKSNIISFVDAMKLKDANMVKLPVIVYNHQKTSDVVMNAITLQRSLEAKALEQEQGGGRYIRPIVLFQAQPKSDDDNVTFDKIKQQLVDIGIPEEQIKIKTSGRDEIKHIDLMSRTCEVRYIITVNALKEGWDCPFAYILASLANKSSKVDVEQILGRVLRLPYTTKHPVDLLNLSYVFTSSNNFKETLDNIIKSLNKAGFSRKDYRVAETPLTTTPMGNPTPMGDLFDNNESAWGESTSNDALLEIDSVAIKEGLTASSSVATLEAIATTESKNYEAKVAEAAYESNDIPQEMKDVVKRYEIKEQCREVAQTITLPRFVYKVDNGSLFGEADSYVLLTKPMLAKEFDLSKEDHKIDFTRTAVDAVAVDLDKNKSDEFVPRYATLTDSQLQYMRNYIVSLTPDGQKRALAGALAKNIKIDEIAEPQISAYIEGVIADFDSEQIADLLTFEAQTTKRVKEKIDSLLTVQREKEFKRYLDIDRVKCGMDWAFPQEITLKSLHSGLSKGLYEEEGDMDNLEYQVVAKIAELENVLFWHRNLERGHGYFLNGFINHYPDFIVVLKSGVIALVETKGGDRVNLDTKQKINLGNKWAQKAGEKYRYFMVFENTEMEGAYTVPQLLRILGEL